MRRRRKRKFDFKKTLKLHYFIVTVKSNRFNYLRLDVVTALKIFIADVWVVCCIHKYGYYIPHTTPEYFVPQNHRKLLVPSVRKVCIIMIDHDFFFLRQVDIVKESFRVADISSY